MSGKKQTLMIESENKKAIAEYRTSLVRQPLRVLRNGILGCFFVFHGNELKITHGRMGHLLVTKLVREVFKKRIGILPKKP